jgi:hypothetical protein
VVVGDEALLQDHLGGVRGADAELVLLLAGAEALHPLLDDERREIAPPCRHRLGHREDDADVADRAVGGEGLGAVEHPAAVDLLGARAGAAAASEPARLGEAPGADHLARGERRHPAPPLLVVPNL